MTLLKAENISCGYGSGDIVSGVSLELKAARYCPLREKRLRKNNSAALPVWDNKALFGAYRDRGRGHLTAYGQKQA